MRRLVLRLLGEVAPTGPTQADLTEAFLGRLLGEGEVLHHRIADTCDDARLAMIENPLPARAVCERVRTAV